MGWKENPGAAWTWYKGEWHSGNPMLMGPMTHAPWLGSCVFDGARAFEGVAPDLDQHCERIVRSATSFGLKIVKSAPEIEALIREGIAKFPKEAQLYLRPMFWGGGRLRRCRSGGDRVLGVGLRSAAAEAQWLLGDLPLFRRRAPLNMCRRTRSRLPIIPIRHAPSARRSRAASIMR